MSFKIKLVTEGLGPSVTDLKRLLADGRFDIASIDALEGEENHFAIRLEYDRFIPLMGTKYDLVGKLAYAPELNVQDIRLVNGGERFVDLRGITLHFEVEKSYS